MENTTLKQLIKGNGRLHHSTLPLSKGLLHHLQADHGISLHGMSAFPSQAAVFYANIYTQNEVGYETVYGIFENGHTPPAIWIEPEGVLPAVFPGPDGHPWTRIVATDKNGDFDRVIPFWDREGVVRPDAKKAIAWDFEGYQPQGALFYHAEMYDPKKPDKFHFVQWNKGIPKPSKTFSLEAPGENWVGIDLAGNMNAFCRKPNRVGLHRQFLADGTVIRQREMQIALAHDAPIEFHFEADSHMFQLMEGKVTHLLIAPDGSITTTQCCTIPVQEDFYSVWKPQPLGKEKWAIQFTHGGGNGWLITSKTQVLQAWLREEGNTYRDILGEETFALPFSGPILDAVTGDNEGGFYTAFYPTVPHPNRVKEVAICYFPD